MAGILLDGLTGDSIFYTTPEEAASTGKASEVSAEDDRAELVLQLLLAGLDAPAPNVGHMLLGFDVEHGPEGIPRAASLIVPPVCRLRPAGSKLHHSHCGGAEDAARLQTASHGGRKCPVLCLPVD